MNNLNQTEKLNDIKKQTMTSIESLTIHGIPNFVRSKSYLIKFIWIILTLASTIISIHFVMKTLQEYFEFNVTTEVRMIDSNNEIDFPTITICNKNKFTSNFSINYIPNIIDSYKSSFKNYSNLTIANLTLEMRKFLTSFPIYIIFRNVDIETRKKMSKTMEEMFVYGRYDNQLLNSTHFEWIYNRDIGNCHKFNSQGSFKTKQANIDSGLTLELLLSQPKELDLIFPDKTLLVSIHDKNYNSYYDLENIIEMRAGEEIDIIIELSIFNKHPLPYSKCELEDGQEPIDNQFYRDMKNYNFSYSRTLCIDFCKYELMIQNETNYESACPNLENSIGILKNKGKNCTKIISALINDITLRELDKYYNENYYNLDQFKSICLTKCPIECKTIKYISYVNRNKYPSIILEGNKIMLKSKNISFNENTILNDLARLRIRFGSMSYMNYKESPTMNTFDLVSNLGGTLGLFLGIILV